MPRGWTAGAAVTICLAFVAAPSMAQDTSPEPTSEGGFLAIYDRLADTDGLSTTIDRLAMSDDGSTIIFTGRGPDGVTIHTVKADGTELTSIPAPPQIEARTIRSLTIARDGSRAFLQAQGPYLSQQLYVVQDGAAYLLMDEGVVPEVSSFEQVQTTATGDTVYFLDQGREGSDIKALAWDGVEPLMVVDDATVFASPVRGDKIKAFAISDDASSIAFILDGYYDADEVYHGQDDVFVAGAGVEQLTNAAEGAEKHRVIISGDGATVVFSDAKPWRKWYAVHPGQGMEQTELGDLGLNFGGLDLTLDGSSVFYADEFSHNGRLVGTDGSYRLDVFPPWTIGVITLAVLDDAAIDDSGEHVAFIHEYATWPSKQAVYIGHLNDAGAVAGAPAIDPPSFLPPDGSASDGGTQVIVHARLTDPDDGIARASAGGLLDGILGSSADLPLYFTALRNDGVWPDPAAADSVYATEGRDGQGSGDPGQMTIRLSAMDPTFTVTLADWAVDMP